MKPESKAVKLLLQSFVSANSHGIASLVNVSPVVVGISPLVESCLIYIDVMVWCFELMLCVQFKYLSESSLLTPFPIADFCMINDKIIVYSLHFYISLGTNHWLSSPAKNIIYCAVMAQTLSIVEL